MADDLEKRLQQEIDRLRTTPPQGGAKTITITKDSPSAGASQMKTIQIYSTASGGGSSSGSRQDVKGGQAAQAEADYPEQPAERPATGVAPYANPFPEHGKKSFPFPFPFEGGADPERVLTIALWAITIVGLLAILLNFEAVTDAIFVFFAELLVGLGSFLLIVGIIAAIVIFVVYQLNNRRWRW